MVGTVATFGVSALLADLTNQVWQSLRNLHRAIGHGQVCLTGVANPDIGCPDATCARLAIATISVTSVASKAASRFASW